MRSGQHGNAERKGGKTKGAPVEPPLARRTRRPQLQLGRSRPAPIISEKARHSGPSRRTNKIVWPSEAARTAVAEMAAENTDLERRVLAHEQILQELMAQLAEDHPHFLDRMRERFAGARRGAHEQDYFETADYAEVFLHEVMRLARGRGERRAVAPAAADTWSSPPARATDLPVVIRCALRGGVWHVTRDDAFFGDYTEQAPARAAAAQAAREVEHQGRRAEVIFDDCR